MGAHYLTSDHYLILSLLSVVLSLYIFNFLYERMILPWIHPKLRSCPLSLEHATIRVCKPSQLIKLIPREDVDLNYSL